MCVMSIRKRIGQLDVEGKIGSNWSSNWTVQLMKEPIDWSKILLDGIAEVYWTIQFTNLQYQSANWVHGTHSDPIRLYKNPASYSMKWPINRKWNAVCYIPMTIIFNHFWTYEQYNTNIMLYARGIFEHQTGDSFWQASWPPGILWRTPWVWYCTMCSWLGNIDVL